MKKLGKLISLLGYLDYVVALACLAYGAYGKSWWYGGAGVVGLVLAYLQPAHHMHRHMEAKLQKSRRRVETIGLPSEGDDIPFVPFGMEVDPSSYLPRSRYQGTDYFAGRGGARQPLSNVRDLRTLVRTEYRDTFGVRPDSVNGAAE